MPFNAAVKTVMFTKCNRHCCLCHKQCGVNIEAAHIVAEAKGGSNDEDNGIPLCFDCHQEIGSYDDRHPRGNKFRPDELRARRDQVYESVAQGRLAGLATDVNSNSHLPNPLHRIIDLLTKYHCVLGRFHHAYTKEAMYASRTEWSSCHAAVWRKSSSRDDTIRMLADPAKEWLSELGSRYVHVDDFNLVEDGAYVLSGFAVSPSPMAMPDVYSKAYSTEDELWQQWNKQGDRYMALGGLIARVKELAARAGKKWEPSLQEG